MRSLSLRTSRKRRDDFHLTTPPRPGSPKWSLIGCWLDWRAPPSLPAGSPPRSSLREKASAVRGGWQHPDMHAGSGTQYYKHLIHTFETCVTDMSVHSRVECNEIAKRSRRLRGSIQKAGKERRRRRKAEGLHCTGKCLRRKIPLPSWRCLRNALSRHHHWPASRTTS